MNQSKKPGEPLETERRAKMEHERFIQESFIQVQYESIRRILKAIQIVQTVQGTLLFIIALTLLLK